MTDTAWTGEMRKGVAELCVLVVLGRQESYGYEISQQLGKSPSLTMKESTLYLILARLERDGLVSVRHVASTRGPKRRYFSLTHEGKQRLADMTAFWRGYSKDVDGLLSGNDWHEQ